MTQDRLTGRPMLAVCLIVLAIGIAFWACIYQVVAS